MAKLPISELLKTDSIPCSKCSKGMTEPYTLSNGDVLPARKCPYCNGETLFTRPDLSLIVKAIKGRKGLRSKRPDDSRAYFVWRMARFHGGADVCAPVMAGVEIAGDPYIPLLDFLAELVSQRVYGTDMAGALRWAHAMGHEVSQDYLTGKNIPGTALPGGPVLSSGTIKPFSEAMELM
jgi:hypothetical protein